MILTPLRKFFILILCVTIALNLPISIMNEVVARPQNETKILDPSLYPFAKEIAVLQALDAEPEDHFGGSLAISGDTVVVGVMDEDGDGINRGAAYVYQRDQGGIDIWGEVTKLTASDMADEDHFGIVAISGDTIVVGAPGEDSMGSNGGAVYIFERNEGGQNNWGEVAKLTSSDEEEGDFFGSVDIDGNTIVVGAKYENGEGISRGAVYIFERNQGGVDIWGEVTKLTASDAQDNDYFGEGVDISRDTIIVSASEEDGLGIDWGAVYVFERNLGGQNNWGEASKLTASDSEDYDYFGPADVSGDTIVVGARFEDGNGIDRGAAYVYERNFGGNNNWGEVTKLTAFEPADNQRFGVPAISGDIIVIGTGFEEGLYYASGAAYVFERNYSEPDTWVEKVRLTSSSVSYADMFGGSLNIDGEYIIIGSIGEDDFASNAGAATVFELNLSATYEWEEITKLTNPENAGQDSYAYSVAVSGDTAVVGDYLESGSGVNRGAAHIYERNLGGRNNWGEVTRLIASDADDNDMFGLSVAIDGDFIVVGALGKDYATGAAYVFQRNQGGPDNWGEVAILTASDAEVGDKFGYSVGVSGDTIVVGANYEDGAGNIRGAAYIYQRNLGGENNWGEAGKLAASDTADMDEFGCSVAISGDSVIVGAPYRGAAYIFDRNEGGVDNWGEVTKLIASDNIDFGYFGYAVAISEDTVVIGADMKTGGGGAYIFDRNQGGEDNWGEVIKLTSFDQEDYDSFGFSVSINRDTVAVGAIREDGLGTNRGAAYVFDRNQGGTNNWGEVTKITASDAEDEDGFGFSVSISEKTVVVGTPIEEVPDVSMGAAYIYYLEPDQKVYLPLVISNN